MTVNAQGLKPIKNGAVTTFAVETLLLQPGIPDAVKRAFHMTLGQLTTSEQVMWREVAARMTLDAFGHTPEVITVRDGMEERKFKSYRKTVQDARHWFLLKANANDREQIFDMCGADLAPVQRAVRELPGIEEPKFMRSQKKGGGYNVRATSICMA